MAQILGIQAFSSEALLRHWWEWTLVSIIGASGLFGIIAFLLTSYRSIRRLLKSADSNGHSLPRSIQERIHLLSQSATYVSAGHDLPSKPSSFGVFLGQLSVPSTEDEVTVLAQWEAVILDPLQPGILEAVNDEYLPLGPHLIARMDLRSFLDVPAFDNEVDMLRAVYITSKAIQQLLRIPQRRRYFTGVLVAGWKEQTSVPLLNGLARLFAAHGLDVFLEIGPPDFLDDVRNLNLKVFSGVVIRNGTILRNGERRDFFGMEKMKTTTKAFVSQSCLRPFSVMMWDTIDDDVDLSHAVARRSHMWCSYHGVTPWIGQDAALMNISKVQPCHEPLAAFQWLKERKVMTVHEKFRNTRILSPNFSTTVEDYLSLQEIFPHLGFTISGLDDEDYDSDFNSLSSVHSTASTLTVQYPEIDENGALLPVSPFSMRLDWTTSVDKRIANPLSCSPSGSVYSCLGCFPVGLNANQDDFHRILKSQRRLKRLNLLSKVPANELRDAGTLLDQYGRSNSRYADVVPTARQAIRDLANVLAKANDEGDDSYQVQVFMGLDSGFHTPSGSQFWAVYEIDARTGAPIFYVSKSVQDLTAVLLHTHLSRCAFSRYQCFLIEYGFNFHETESTLYEELPRRLEQDLALLSSSDLLLYLQHMRFSEWDQSCPLLSAIRTKCEELLIDVPTYRQLKRLSNMDYLSETISDEELVNARFKWYRQCRIPSIDRHQALRLFREVDYRLRSMLRKRDHAGLDTITSAIEKLADKDMLDCAADFVLFAIFCAARRAAFEEVYIEVSDRNPLFNQYSDQSAAFAELFALGSRCEAYFDLTPSDFGLLLSKKHREYYNQPEHQPPMWIGNAPSFASAYAAAETDIDPDQKPSVLPGYRRFTFLSVFAIPALVDIMLLSTTGHGLYLSAFMSYTEQKYATLALMTSLLLSGAIGTWISIGGTYYLMSSAYSAANMFVLTRLIGGLAFTAAGGLLGFIVITPIHGVQAGAIFFFYLFGLTSYLSVLAVLSTYQVPRSSFLNGRKVIILLIPTLIISPILTLWIRGYDVIIYLSVLYLFVIFLTLGARYVGAKWVTWFHDIKTLDDAAVKDWYARTHARPTTASDMDRLSKDARLSIARSSSTDEPDIFFGLSEPAVLVMCRKALYDAVMKEKDRRFWQKSTEDKFVKDLATCWESTLFLLDWYCRLTETKRPIPYSSTWNLETQVALESMQQAQKGIRLHNSFIHWRNAGDEVGTGILYFLTALMDRWLDLVQGGHLVGLSAALNKTYRLSVGFGLAYYLIGAVLLDYKAQHLHQLSEQAKPVSIEDIPHIRKAKANDKKFRRHLYWNTLCRFLGVHVWALSLSAALVWIFNGSGEALIMFLAYVGAYSGLLLYQYNKIFSGPHAVMPLLMAVIIGFPLGMILKRVHPTFEQNNVIALAVTTWTAALLSFKTAKLGLPEAFEIRTWFSEFFAKFKRSRKPSDSRESVDIPEFGLSAQLALHWSSVEEFHAYNGAGPDHEWSQSELEAFYNKLQAGPKENRFRLSAFSHPGTQVTALLLSCTHESLSRLALHAFPAMPYLTQRMVSAWQNGSIKLYIVPMRSVVDEDADLRAISHYSKGSLTILLASDAEGINTSPLNVSSNCRVIAETLVHACSETMFGLHHSQADIAESLLVCRQYTDDAYVVSECSKRTMPFGGSDTEAAEFTTSCRKDLLRSLCLGIDCETRWDSLPLEVRNLFLRRCLGIHNHFTSSEMAWINANVPGEDACTISTRVARYDLGAFLAIQKYNYFVNHPPQVSGEKGYRQKTADIRKDYHPILNRSATSILSAFFARIKLPFSYTYHKLGTWIKFFVLAAMADPEYQRELNSALKDTPAFVAKPTTIFLTGLWIYARWAMGTSLPFFVYYGRKDVGALANTIKGSIIAQKKDRIVIRNHDQPETAFVHRAEDRGFKLIFYPGILKTEPTWGHTRISTFGKDMRLLSRVEYKNAAVTNEFVYEYPKKRPERLGKLTKPQSAKIPVKRTCISGNAERAEVQYNLKGHVESGSFVLHGNLVRFKYHYRKNAKYDDELLRAEFVLPHMSANVSWCAPPVRHAEKMERWIPTTRVHEATFVQGADVYEASWLYDHRFHPTITTRLNGEVVDTPDMIRYDWLGVLKKPTHCTITDENPLLAFRHATSSFLGRLFRTNIKRQPVSTSRARSQLWKAWKKRNDLDGVVIRWVDEQLLRRESLLGPYWRRRDRGSLLKAEDYLALHADAVMASSDLSSDISAWTPLAVRISDLFSFGQGGDAVIYTRTKTLARDSDNTLHVIAVDTGTWPNEGGGVSACRRDLINNLRTIKWHMVVESANDFGLPKHQTEENVESLKVLPLWGLDFLHPNHGMFTNKLDSEVDHLFRDATITDIRTNFIPTLTALVRGARALTMTPADVKQSTRALVNLNTYFQDSRHWKEVWTSDIVKDTWRKLWLTEDMPDAQAPSEWFRTELPTLGHLDTALELWFRYLFIFSIPIPEKIPSVFQASHHSVSASYGIVCKLKRGCTLQIWDHAISWRETNLYLSSAMCTLPPFIRNALLGLMKLTSTLILHHADQILPCADFFNPGWEVEIGSSKGQLTHRNVFKRKVDPIVNGITDMQKFAPVSEIKTKTPTVTMLSHVWFAKDIKTALLAADIITNEWGFKDYKLDIYGALNKSPVYSSECQELLACKGLGTSVALRGTADPGMVLANSWLFLNSSVSEGLPLALGEAALTGAPVVCTDVGASLRVLTDPNGKCYSEVVAPNDAYGLARAQINLLAMLDEWAQYADDDPSHPAPKLPHKPTLEDVEIITRRMYEKSDHRRKLGMMARSIVQKSFGGERYLREHEQMLWVGKSRYEMLGINSHEPPARHPSRKRVSTKAPRTYEEAGSSYRTDLQLEKMAHPRRPLLKNVSVNTSFSSVYMDEPGPSNGLYDRPRGPPTTATAYTDSSITHHEPLPHHHHHSHSHASKLEYYHPSNPTSSSSDFDFGFDIPLPASPPAVRVRSTRRAVGKHPQRGSRLPSAYDSRSEYARYMHGHGQQQRIRPLRPESYRTHGTGSTLRPRSTLHEVWSAPVVDGGRF